MKLINKLVAADTECTQDDCVCLLTLSVKFKGYMPLCGMSARHEYLVLSVCRCNKSSQGGKRVSEAVSVKNETMQKARCCLRQSSLSFAINTFK